VFFTLFGERLMNKNNAGSVSCMKIMHVFLIKIQKCDAR
jgi:hypothetical protein